MPQTLKPALKLREQLHAIIRTKHYRLHTEKTYWYWIRYFIRFHRLCHLRDMAEAEVAQFLAWLATHKNIARLIHETCPQTKKASGLSFIINMFRQELD